MTKTLGMDLDPDRLRLWHEGRCLRALAETLAVVAGAETMGTTCPADAAAGAPVPALQFSQQSLGAEAREKVGVKSQLGTQNKRQQKPGSMTNVQAAVISSVSDCCCCGKAVASLNAIQHEL